MPVSDSDLSHLDPPDVEESGQLRTPRSAAGSAGLGSSFLSNRPVRLKPRNEFPEEDEDDEDDLDEEDETLREALRNAPAWLVSTVFHMLLLVVLGLFVVGSSRQADDLEFEVGYTDEPGGQLEDASSLDSGVELESLDSEELASASDLTAIDEPTLALPTLERIPLAPLDATKLVPSASAAGSGIGIALSGRGDATRQGLLDKYGGTKDTEAAVRLGLAWLAKQQRSDGSWSLKGPYPDGGRDENSAAATAMALLAFQGHGNTHQAGRYQKTVDKGWQALMKMQDREGRFVGKMDLSSQMLYTHAQGTIAACEILAMTGDPRFHDTASRAVKYALDAQDPEQGGWRYQPRHGSDTSVTGWFIMALQSARMAELPVPNKSLIKASAFLDSVAIDGGRGYGYYVPAFTSIALCAEGLLCRQYLGWKRDDPRLIEGATALLKSPVEFGGQNEENVYYWYYATQVAHHMEGEIWEKWNKQMRVALPAQQIKKGPEKGSWEPQRDRWGSEGGRLYTTCLSIYSLEVYYRHLPIYAGYSAIEQLPTVDEMQEVEAMKEAAGIEDEQMPDDAQSAPSETPEPDPN